MNETAKYLCSNIQGCKLAYVQSDEISLLLTDYEKLDTSAWFDNNIQKMVSISASMATLAFNDSFSKLAKEYIYSIENFNTIEDEVFLYDKYGIETFVNEGGEVCIPDKFIKMLEIYRKRLMTAMFDSRVFNLPKEEVINCFIWRQQDAIRNSKQGLGQAYYSHRELEGKSTKDIINNLIRDYNIDWNTIDTGLKMGRCVVKKKIIKENCVRNKWIIDNDIPEFKEDREYVNQYV